MGEPKVYHVNELFGPTLQGEGVRAGTVNLWLRFAHCNLRCSVDGPVMKGRDDTPAGFDCDTEFQASRKMTGQCIVEELLGLDRTRCRSVVVSGGEPSLQLDINLVMALRDAGFYVAVESNGTRPLPHGLDWVTVSPKSAEHTLRPMRAVDELKYVRAVGQLLPKPSLKAGHYLVSPAFEPDGSLRRETLEWCIQLCVENPPWRLSCQLHKWWGVR